MRIEQIANFKSCLTCGFRKFQLPSNRNGELVFKRFTCAIAGTTGKDVVSPEYVCEHWKGVTLEID